MDDETCITLSPAGDNAVVNLLIGSAIAIAILPIAGLPSSAAPEQPRSVLLRTLYLFPRNDNVFLRKREKLRTYTRASRGGDVRAPRYANVGD